MNTPKVRNTSEKTKKTSERNTDATLPLESSTPAHQRATGLNPMSSHPTIS